MGRWIIQEGEVDDTDRYDDKPNDYWENIVESDTPEQALYELAGMLNDEFMFTESWLRVVTPDDEIIIV